MTYFALSAVVALLFVPGILCLHLFSRYIASRLSKIDLILSGTIIWNFIFLVPSLYLGLFTSFLLGYFFAFALGSICVILIYVLFVCKQIASRSIKIEGFLARPRFFQGFGMLYLALILGFVILLTLFTSIIQNIDAVLYYLPMAEAINRTGTMEYNPLYLSKIAMTYPPALPAMYAFVMNLTGGLYLRFMPVVYFVLTNLVIFQMSSRLSGKLGRLAPMVAYSSMLSTQMLVILEGLSLDLGYVFYTTMAIYALMRCLEKNNTFWCVIAGLACGLAAMTKELGILTVLFVFSVLLLYSEAKHRRAGFLLVSVFSFLGIEIVQMTLVTRTPGSVSLSVSFLHRLFLFSVLFVLLWCLSDKNSVDRNCAVKISQLGLFVICWALPCVFYVRNFVSLGLFTPGFAPSLEMAITSARVPLPWPSFQTPELSSPLALPFVFHLDWYVIFLTVPVGIPFGVIGIAGLIVLVRRFISRREPGVRIILISFVFLLVMWSYLSSFLSWPSYELSFWPSYQYRRLYYFAPLLSIMIGEGLDLLAGKLGLGKRAWLYFITFSSLSFTYIWSFRQTLAEFNLRWIFELRPEDLVVSTSLLVLVLLTPKLVRLFLRDSSWRGLSAKLQAFLTITVLSINMLFPASLIYASTVNLRGNGLDPGYYDRIESCPPALDRGPWLEIINYYNQNVKDDNVTLMFYSYVFAYFTNRPIIDPYRAFSYEPLILLLKIQDRDLLMNKLSEMRIKYFIIPKPSFLEVYTLYEMFAERYVLFKVIEGNPALPIGERVHSI